MQPTFFVKVENTPTASEPFDTLDEALVYFDASVLGWKEEEIRPTITLLESEDGGKTWIQHLIEHGNMPKTLNSYIHESHINNAN